MQLIWFLNVTQKLSATHSWQIFQLFLLNEYRGADASLSEVLASQRDEETFLGQLWNFYLADRLHLIRCLRHVVANTANPQHPYQVRGFSRKIIHLMSGVNDFQGCSRGRWLFMNIKDFFFSFKRCMNIWMCYIILWDFFEMHEAVWNILVYLFFIIIRMSQLKTHCLCKHTQKNMQCKKYLDLHSECQWS